MGLILAGDVLWRIAPAAGLTGCPAWHPYGQVSYDPDSPSGHLASG